MKYRVLPVVIVISVLAAIAGCGSTQSTTQTAVKAPAPAPAPKPAPEQTAEASPPAAPEDAVPLDSAVIRGQLPNGITYYIRQHDEPRDRVELRLAVNAGSLQEDDDQRGLAHFVEHMAFNGTESFEKQELVGYLESIGIRFGADLNAYTSFDETVYMLQVPTDDEEILHTGIQVLSEWASKITFDPEEIDKERGVVIEEWRLGRGAGARIFDKQAPVMLKDSRYAERLIIGKKEILENAPRDTIVRYYRDWYRPDLMAVVAVGDVDPDEMEALIRKNFEPIPAHPDPRPRETYLVPEHSETLYSIVTDPEATMTRVRLMQKLPPSQLVTEADYRRSLVEGLYDSMLNQRMQERGREADPPYIAAGGGVGNMVRGMGAYNLVAIVDEGGLDRGLEAILIEAERVARFGFTDTELERAKSAYLRGMEQAYRERDKVKSRSFASEYVRNFFTAEAAPGIAGELELAKRYVPGISLEEVNALADTWLEDGSRVIAVSGPEKAGLEPPSESAIAAVVAGIDAATIEPYDDRVSDQPLMASVPPEAEIVTRSEIPELGVTRWQLANGVIVVLKPTDFKNDEIRFTAFSPGGTSLVSDEDWVPAMTADTVVLEGGVGSFDLTQLQKMLADKVVSVGTYISELEEGVSGSASPDDMETMFQLISLYFTEPRRSDQAFASVTQKYRGFVENRLARPEAEYADTVTRVITQDHVRRRPWSLELVDEMNLDTSFEVYRDRFADASDFTFIFVGNFELDQIRPYVQSYLGSLPSLQRDETWRDVGVEAPQGVVEKVVQRGIEPKSRVSIMFPHDFEWDRDNRFVMRSLAQALRIQLREVLREDEGGTYGVSVRASVNRIPRQTSMLSVTFGCEPVRVEELTNLVYDELRKVQADGPKPETVEKIQEQDRRTREVQLRENGFWLSSLESYLWNEEDPRLILEFDELVDGLSVEAIKDAANRWVDFDRRVVVTLMPEEQ
jgi:zinc protease